MPGEALSLVVIDRIPFGVPDDPLTARPHRPHPRGGRRPVRRLPAAARRAGAEAGVRAADPQPRRPRHRGVARRARSRASLRRHAAGQPARRLPAHRIAGRRRRVLGARPTAAGRADPPPAPPPHDRRHPAVPGRLPGRLDPPGILVARAQGRRPAQRRQRQHRRHQRRARAGQGLGDRGAARATRPRGSCRCWVGRRLGASRRRRSRWPAWRRSSATCSRSSCAAAAARASRRRWAWRWRCRRWRR